jgi:WD40 repeat protein
MNSPARHVRLLAACAIIAIACSGARATSNQSDPAPGFQLGDSVTMPTTAVNAGHDSQLAFHLAEKDLLPESIAFDPKNGSFYVGSTRKGKVIRVDAKGAAHEFIAPRQDGLWMVIGIKAHPTRRVLWVCSFDGGNLEGHKASKTNASGVFTFNLDTGKLIRKWVLDAPGEVHGFNDVTLTRDNDAYVTHMFNEAAIYRITHTDQKLELFLKTEGLTDINGITLSPDERTLFVAGNEGVQAIDVATKRARLITPTEGQPMTVIDGLYYYNGGLLGIRGNSINWYQLDDNATRVVVTNILEKDHPLMDIPTTGVLVGDEFYYVAASMVDAVKPDGTIPPGRLSESPILKLKLR